MKVLVTGANGYIGSKVVELLCDKGVNVIATDLKTDNIDSRANIKIANILTDNCKDWFSYFDEPDVCLHMAWRDGFVHNSDNHILDLYSHYNFIRNLIDSGLKQIAIMGSMHEVGYWEGKVDENTPCNPQTPYGIAKNALRELVQSYIAGKNCLFQWLRGFYIYGDDLFGNSIFCKLRRAEKEGKQVFPFTSGKNEYDFIYINDIAEQICACIMQKEVGGIINCCSGKPVSLAQHVEWYIKTNNLKIKLDYGKYPDRAYDSPCIYGDDTKIKYIMQQNKFN